MNAPVPKVNQEAYSEEILRPKGGDRRRYTQLKKEVATEARELEQELRRIFKERKRNRRDVQHRSGRSINIKQRIGEVAKKMSPVKSRAWERKEAPLERDYAITLLIDLTGSMYGEKITETFKALIAMAEPLQRLSIKFEVLGFNSQLNVYKEFKEPFNDKTRESLGNLEKEVRGDNANNTDDGWALHIASKRLEKVNAKRKFIIVCTDGGSNPSPAHAHPFFDLDEVLSRIELSSDQKVIGIGLGQFTNYVEEHYLNGIAGVEIDELKKKLSTILQEIIRNGK